MGGLAPPATDKLRPCTFMQFAPESYRFAEVTQNNGHYAVQGHSRSPILLLIESSLCDFLLVINTNLPCILHRFRDIAFAIFGYPCCVRLPRRRGSPETISVKFFRGCQQMDKVTNAIEKLPKIATGWVGWTSVTDDRRQTDRRATAYSEREREFTNKIELQHLPKQLGPSLPLKQYRRTDIYAATRAAF